MTQLSRTKTAIILTFLVFMWGINWPLSKFALHYTPPVLFAGVRTLIGGFILLLFALPKYKELHLKETWHLYVISSLLNIIIFYGLQTVGLQYMPAGLFSAIVFLQPVLLGIFSWIWLEESMYGLKIFGLVLGFIGVGVISSSSLTGHISIIGILLALGCAIGWALGTVFIKKTGHRVNAIWMVTLQLIIGGLCLMDLVQSLKAGLVSLGVCHLLAYFSLFHSLLLQWGGLHTSHLLELVKQVKLGLIHSSFH